jgi:hypothetical protein
MGLRALLLLVLAVVTAGVGQARGGEGPAIPRLECPLLIAAAGVTESAVLLRDACQEIGLWCDLRPQVTADDLAGACDPCSGQATYGALLVVMGGADALEGAADDLVGEEIDRLTALLGAARRSFIPTVVGLFDRRDAPASTGCERMAQALLPLADLILVLDGACGNANAEPAGQEKGIPLLHLSDLGDLPGLLRQLFSPSVAS